MLGTQTHCARDTCSNLLTGKSNKYCSFGCSSAHKSELKISAWLAGEWSGDTEGGLSRTIRSYLIVEAKGACSQCGFNTVHPLDGTSVLEINHIDGDNKNHCPSNLEVLCPNCHALTPNYRARNSGQGRVKRRQAEALQNNPNYLGTFKGTEEDYKQVVEDNPDKILIHQEKKITLCTCGNPKDKGAKNCSTCHTKKVAENVKLASVDVQVLLDRLETESYTKVASDYGVSDNGLRAHLKANSAEGPRKKGMKKCPECGVLVMGGKFPYYCPVHKIDMKLVWPPVDEVVKFINQKGVNCFMEEYNIKYVSTVRKFLARHGCLEDVNLSKKFVG